MTPTQKLDKIKEIINSSNDGAETHEEMYDSLSADMDEIQAILSGKTSSYKTHQVIEGMGDGSCAMRYFPSEDKAEKYADNTDYCDSGDETEQFLVCSDGVTLKPSGGFDY